MSELRPLEIGLILAGELDAIDLEAVSRLSQNLSEQFQNEFPQFEWTVELVPRQELIDVKRVEPMTLIDLAREERDGRNWDFVFAMTSADLITHYKPFAYAAISRAVDTAVISTARIDPRMENPQASRETRVSQVSRRLLLLIYHVSGQILGLEQTDNPDNWQFKVRTLSDIDRLSGATLTPEQRETIQRNLELIADLRLEEVRTPQAYGHATFYLKSSWLNRHEIADAVWQARPWEFPRRLNRLTTAAFSTAVILTFAAESWALAASQSGVSITVFAVAALLATTCYITQRQQLLVRRERRISEQSVITNISAVGIVLFGMLVTFTVTLLLIVVISLLLFRPELVKEWASLHDVPVDEWHYGFLAVFVASLAMVVGALGASFEEQHYFRHITFVDEEI